MSIKFYDGTMMLCRGDCRYIGFEDIDLILTNVYGPIPEAYHKKPMLVSQFTSRKDKVREWVGAELFDVSETNGGLEMVWGANIDPVDVNLTDLKPDGNYYDLQLPMRLLTAYGWRGMKVWDGFMGRGTVGRACQMLGMKYIGIDIDPRAVDRAAHYLGMKGVTA